jgi:hypothetical protein
LVRIQIWAIKNTKIIYKDSLVIKNLSAKPFIIYSDLVLNVNTIFKYNATKSGVYRCNNLITGRPM